MEKNRRFYYDIKLPIDTGRQVKWMDGYRLATVANGKSFVFDYDGVNLQELSVAIAASNVFFDGDYAGLYNIAPSVTVPSRFAVTRTELTVK